MMAGATQSSWDLALTVRAAEAASFYRRRAVAASVRNAERDVVAGPGHQLHNGVADRRPCVLI